MHRSNDDAPQPTIRRPGQRVPPPSPQLTPELTLSGHLSTLGRERASHASRPLLHTSSTTVELTPRDPMRLTSLRASRPDSVLALLGLAFLLLAGAGCKDSLRGVNAPEILINPTTVIFAPGGSSDQTRTISIENIGGGTLDITGFRFSGTTNAVRMEGLEGLSIPAGERRTFRIVFLADSAAAAEGVLRISSNALSGRDAEVIVTTESDGTQLFAVPPVIELLVENLDEQATGSVQLGVLGARDVEVRSIALFDAFGEFELLDVPPLPATIRPNDEDSRITLQVRYTAVQPRDVDAEIEVGCDADNCRNGTVTIPVRLIAALPAIEVTPSPLAFSPPSRGVPDARTLTIRNVGRSPLTLSRLFLRDLSSPDLNDEGPEPADCVITNVGGTPFAGPATDIVLAPDQSVEVTLTYTPQRATGLQAELVVHANDPYMPVTRVPLGGSIPEPILVVEPEDYVDFGTIAQGVTGRRTVRIRNDGSAELTVGSARLVRGVNAFRIANPNLFPLSLGAGEEAGLVLEFTTPSNALPTTFYDELLELTDHNDPAADAEVYLVVEARAGAQPYCEVMPDPSRIMFGQVARGSSIERRGRVRNIGTGPCIINGIVKQTGSGFPFNLIPGFAPDYFTLVGVEPARFLQPGQELLPGDEFEVTVRYSPRTVSTLGDTLGDQGSLEIRAVDPASGESVRCGTSDFGFGGFGTFNRLCGINLRGFSGVPEIAAIPGRVEAGLVTLGCSSQEVELAIFSVGNMPVTIERVRFSAQCDGRFQVAGFPNPGPTLEPNQSFRMRVRYRPAGITRTSCNLIFEGTMEGGQYVVPMRGEGTNVSRVIDRFTQRSGRDVDVLFVIDNSGSMGNLQSNLQRNIDAFVAEARRFDSDFQFGVVTTQTAGRISDPTGGQRDPGQLLGSALRIFTPQNDPDLTQFRRTLLVGTSNSSESAIERGFDSARLALSDPLITDLEEDCSACSAPYMCVNGGCGGYNRGFLRRQAALEIIFLSDEEEQSNGTLDFFVDFFKSIKGFRNDSLFAASSIAGPPAGTPGAIQGGGCGGSGPDNRQADPGRRYYDIAQRTGGDFASICDPNFSTVMRQIGQRTFGLQNEFFLSRVADPNTVVVRVGGQVRTSGYRYQQDSNSIIWNEGAAPPAGTQFEVEYEAACF